MLICLIVLVITPKALALTTAEKEVSDFKNKEKQNAVEFQKSYDELAKTTLEKDKSLIYLKSKSHWSGAITLMNGEKIDISGVDSKLVYFDCERNDYFYLYMKPNDSLSFSYFSNGKIEYVDQTGSATITNEKISCVDNPAGGYSVELIGQLENDNYDSFFNKYDTADDKWMIEDIKEQAVQSDNIIDHQAVLIVYTNHYWTGTITDSGEDSSTIEKQSVKLESILGVFPLQKNPFECEDSGKYEVRIMNIPSDDYAGNISYLFIGVVQNGKVLDYGYTNVRNGIVTLNGECASKSIIPINSNSKGGGCLIATATYDSELAPQVQQLRELRDNSLLQTASGTSFMSGFNQFYYSFSPTIADWERESPVFKEAVKIAITPMLSTLSIMTLADSEVEVLGLGLSVIVLNIGMYFVAPAVVIHTIRKKL